MEPTDPIARYRRYMKRRNYSVCTVKNYMNILSNFSGWLQIPVEDVTTRETDAYMEHLLRRRRKPKTINCHLGCIHAFYETKGNTVLWLETSAPGPPDRHSYRFERDWEYLAERLRREATIATGD